MRGAFQIARLFDIPVRVHWSFFLLPLFIAWSNQRQGSTWNDTAWSFLFLAALFVCVVLHEFGHILMARRFGVGTKDIILSPIGGIARLYSLPEKPGQEFQVALAGPMVNVVIAALLGPLAWWFWKDELYVILAAFFESPQAGGEPSGSFLDYFIPGLFLLNIALAVFNLLPAFPMDGGRIFRALLSYRFTRLKATRIAARVGQVVALLLTVYSFQEGSYLTSLIGVFIFFMAQMEYRNVKTDHALSTLLVGEVFDRGYSGLTLSDTLERALALSLEKRELDFLVFQEDGDWVGVLTSQQLARASREPALGLRPVKEFYKPVWAGLTPTDTLKAAMERFYYTGSPLLPVFEGKEIIGTVSSERLTQGLKTLFRNKADA